MKILENETFMSRQIGTQIRNENTPYCFSPLKGRRLRGGIYG